MQLFSIDRTSPSSYVWSSHAFPSLSLYVSICLSSSLPFPIKHGSDGQTSSNFVQCRPAAAKASFHCSSSAWCRAAAARAPQLSTAKSTAAGHASAQLTIQMIQGALAAGSEYPHLSVIIGHEWICMYINVYICVCVNIHIIYIILYNIM